MKRGNWKVKGTEQNKSGKESGKGEGKGEGNGNWKEETE